MKAYKTEQRTRILSYLESRHDACLTAAEIAAALFPSVSKSAVYRNLADLESEGKVVRVTLAGDRAVGYRFQSGAHCAGKIHISCVRCGKTEHVSPNAAASFERALRDADGFSLNKAECLLYGVCRECRGEGKV